MLSTPPLRISSIPSCQTRVAQHELDLHVPSSVPDGHMLSSRVSSLSSSKTRQAQRDRVATRLQTPPSLESKHASHATPSAVTRSVAHRLPLPQPFWFFLLLLLQCLVLFSPVSSTEKPTQKQKHPNHTNQPHPHHPKLHKNNFVPELDFAKTFYEMALTTTTNNNSTLLKKQVHLLRIPKASSTSMSIVARRIAGCYPRGPCCKYPGDPPGSCPSKELFKCELQQKVIGCTHHKANYHALMDPKVLSITIMRDPVTRAISSFIYGGIHSNRKDCKGDHDKVR
jgi:hypothetical protein